MVGGGLARRGGWLAAAGVVVAACAVQSPTGPASDSCAEPHAKTSQALGTPTCVGNPEACAFRRQPACKERYGCTWDYGQRNDPYDDVCVPAAAGLLPCAALTTSLECELDTGCTWSVSRAAAPAPPQASATPSLGCPGAPVAPAPRTDADAAADAPGML